VTSAQVKALGEGVCPVKGKGTKRTQGRAPFLSQKLRMKDSGERRADREGALAVTRRSADKCAVGGGSKREGRLEVLRS